MIFHGARPAKAGDATSRRSPRMLPLPHKWTRTPTVRVWLRLSG